MGDKVRIEELRKTFGEKIRHVHGLIVGKIGEKLKDTTNKFTLSTEHCTEWTTVEHYSCTTEQHNYFVLNNEYYVIEASSEVHVGAKESKIITYFRYFSFLPDLKPCVYIYDRILEEVIPQEFKVYISIRWKTFDINIFKEVIDQTWNDYINTVQEIYISTIDKIVSTCNYEVTKAVVYKVSWRIEPGSKYFNYIEEITVGVEFELLELDLDRLRMELEELMSISGKCVRDKTCMHFTTALILSLIKHMTSQ